MGGAAFDHVAADCCGASADAGARLWYARGHRNTLEAAGLLARDLHIAMELNSTEAILGCIESGVGVGFVSRSAVRRQLVMGTLAIVPVTGLTIPRNLLLLTPAGPEPTGAAAAMLELLQQHRTQLRRAPKSR